MNYNVGDIIEKIATNLSIKDKYKKAFDNSQKQAIYKTLMSSTSLCNGLIGPCLVFAELDYLNDNDLWAEKAHEYLSLAVEDIAYITNDTSMCDGVTGMALAVQSLSKNGTRYTKLLETLNTKIIDLLEQFIESLDITSGMSYLEYDTLYGLSGTINYLLDCKQEENIVQIVKKALEKLVMITNDIEIFGNSVPAFYLSSDKYFMEQEKIAYPRGSFNTSLSHGMAGIISTFSKAIKCGYGSKKIEEAIDKLIGIIKKCTIITDGYERVKGIISYDEFIGEVIDDKGFARDAWCYGNPGVGYAIIMAGKYLKRDDYIEWGIYLIKEVLKDIKGIYSPTFCHGYAGLLAIVTVIDNSLEDNIFTQEREMLIEKIMSFYEQDYEFGFYDCDIDSEGTVIKKTEVGLIEGVTGTLLALLLNDNNKTYTNWKSFFGLFD